MSHNRPRWPYNRFFSHRRNQSCKGRNGKGEGAWWTIKSPAPGTGSRAWQHISGTRETYFFRRRHTINPKAPKPKRR